MKRNLIFTLLTVTCFLTSCAPYMNAVWEKEGYKMREFENVAVVAVTKNLEARKSIEGFIIQNLQKNHSGTRFFTGMSMIPPDMDSDKVTQDYINDYLKKNQIDAVITTSLVNTYTSNQLVTGNAYYSPYFYGPGPYIYNTWGMMYSPDYYVQSQNFVIQSSIFDLREGVDNKTSLVWKGESSIADPYSITDGAYDYAKNLVRFIDKNYFNK